MTFIAADCCTVTFAVLNVAVMPLGRFVAEKEIADLNPP